MQTFTASITYIFETSETNLTIELLQILQPSSFTFSADELSAMLVQRVKA